MLHLAVGDVVLGSDQNVSAHDHDAFVSSHAGVSRKLFNDFVRQIRANDSEVAIRQLEEVRATAIRIAALTRRAAKAARYGFLPNMNPLRRWYNRHGEQLT